ncbi:MAG TPA: lysophospholipid acyltransferase family protein [Clostridia bacterium]|nr:lysophospholipid acyltransferase family protein [Clostridia bacterium]HQO70322.1 lysophospholipid acyltransferase family protein [Clostridia bacterium]
MKHLAWFKSVYAILRIPLTVYYKVFHNYHYKKYSPESRPFIVLANHNSDGDQFMVGMAIKGHMFFVASEHIVRSGFGGKLVKLLANPIIRKKGAEAKSTIDEIQRRLKEGTNVCMFVEGNRSFNGQTGWISPANGALVKNSNASLITFRLDGGYFRTPRWAEYKRKGPEFGYVVNEYSQEKLKSMSEDEITKAIRNDLYANAFDWQKKNKHRYKGKNLAEYLETVLFICPKCKAIDTLKSKNDIFSCSCGFSVRINDYCCFEPLSDDTCNFEHVYDWDRWQRDYLKKNISNLKTEYINKPILKHSGQTLSRINITKNAEALNTGIMELYSDKLVITSADYSQQDVFRLSDIIGFSVTKMMTIFFSTKDGGYYEIKSDIIRTGVGYLMFYRYLTDRDYV